jgi:xanthine dehydrogenase iron-sulfur cluster and FAD-binding subunit A
LAQVVSIPQQDSAERAFKFNKLTRTFAAQMSALKGYRSKGEQKKTVQHVHVAVGGQAIVATSTPPPKG